MPSLPRTGNGRAGWAAARSPARSSTFPAGRLPPATRNNCPKVASSRNQTLWAFFGCGGPSNRTTAAARRRTARSRGRGTRPRCNLCCGRNSGPAPWRCGTFCRRRARRRQNTKTGIRHFWRSVGKTSRQWRRTASHLPRDRGRGAMSHVASPPTP